MLDRLRDSGPLPGDAIEDRAAVSWTSTGWTNGRNVERMLDILWKQGVVTVVGRDGLRRLWGLADFPAVPDLPPEEVVAQAAEHALRALGVARARDVERHFTIGRYPGLDLERAGWARPSGGGGDRIPRVVRGRCLGQLLRPGGVRRILSTGESAGRSRRAQAR